MNSILQLFTVFDIDKLVHTLNMYAFLNCIVFMLSRDESGSRFERFIRRRKENISFNQLCCAIILVTLALGAIVFLGVFPASFVYLDYYQVSTGCDR